MRYFKGMLPRTDALLARSLNISIGVSDPGLSSAFGVTIRDGLDVVDERARLFRDAANKYLGAGRFWRCHRIADMNRLRRGVLGTGSVVRNFHLPALAANSARGS